MLTGNDFRRWSADEIADSVRALTDAIAKDETNVRAMEIRVIMQHELKRREAEKHFHVEA